MPAKSQPPLFMFGDLDRKVYVVTKYTRLKNGSVVAHDKHDVTQDFKNFARRMAGEGII